MGIKGTQTQKNLHAAFAGESQARNKYTFYAMAARDQGHDDIADAFERMARNEMAHAKIWYEAIYGSSKTTMENLMDAASGEFAEWHGMYPKFAEEARADGLDGLAVMFEQVAAIEKDHERQFMMMLAALSGKPQGAQDNDAAQGAYRCMFCGAVYEKAPDVCEVCHAIGSFELT